MNECMTIEGDSRKHYDKNRQLSEEIAHNITTLLIELAEQHQRIRMLDTLERQLMYVQAMTIEQ